MNGFIKLHRSMLDWEWYKDANTARVFLHLLLVANWQDGKWHGVEVKRGQRLTSYASLAKETRISVQSVRTALSHLISTGEITCEPTNKYTLITIANYEKYQGEDADTNTQSNAQNNEKLTSNQQATNTQLTTNKERNKARKRESNNYISIITGNAEKTPAYKWDDFQETGYVPTLGELRSRLLQN